MAHKKETPRQKMIGMMYLVLTALLALNVSREVLEAFAIVDKGLTKTTENFSDKNNLLYADFKQLSITNPIKAGKLYNEALQVREKANALYNYIQLLKIKIITKADKKTKAVDTTSTKDKKIIDPEKITSKENMDIPAEVMIGDDNNAEGKVLKNKIIDFKNFILSLIKKDDNGIIGSIKTNLNTDNPPAKEAGETPKWETEHFERLPLIAVTTLMSKMQNDVRNAESEILRYLFYQVEAGSFKFNKLEGTVIANSNYIIKGTSYQADVFIAAFDTTINPKIYLGNYEPFKTSDGETDYKMVGSYDSTSIRVDSKTGKGVFTQGGGSVGIRKWGGLIKMIASDGTTIKRPFHGEYQVAEPIAVISPTKMNVFYLGVDNPVDISVAGVPGDKIFPSISNGAIRKSGKGWVVNPRSTGTATVSVAAEIDKSRKSMGSMLFRVKQLPDPVAKVANRTRGTIGKNELALQQVVLADLGESNDFDAKFTVTEFTVSAKVQGFVRDEMSHSNKITEAQRALIRSLNKGERVTFTDITAIGPDGKTREINGIILKLQ
jgi:gliding motility-associated protein GldM